MTVLIHWKIDASRSNQIGPNEIYTKRGFYWKVLINRRRTLTQLFFLEENLRQRVTVEIKDARMTVAQRASDVMYAKTQEQVKLEHQGSRGHGVNGRRMRVEPETEKDTLLI